MFGMHPFFRLLMDEMKGMTPQKSYDEIVDQIFTSPIISTISHDIIYKTYSPTDLVEVDSFNKSGRDTGLGITGENKYFVVGVIVELAKKYFEEDYVKCYNKMLTQGFLKYLVDYYDVLHTQSYDYIAEDYQEYYAGKS
jgi:hypothetical protein